LTASERGTNCTVTTTSALTGFLGTRSKATSLDHTGHSHPTGPPGLRLAMSELTAPAQAYRLALARRRLRSAPRARVPASLVIDVPGWGAPESLTGPLRGFLRSLGHDAQGWGFGRNRGDVQGDVRRLEKHVVAQAAEHGSVSLVGWSLGGVIVREVARRRPQLVRQVVTFGSPIVGGTTHTVGARMSGHPASTQLETYIERRDREHPITVPVTVILSRRDGVVSWLSCLDHHSPLAEHVEVRSTHLGMVLDPDVWLTIAERLARG
jgi:pimeloyl-ACP methyl ester carboxylesterase